MATCTFFGHKTCCSVGKQALSHAIEQVIACGVDTFYVGNQGTFDRLVYASLLDLQQKHAHIRFFVTLAYLPNDPSAIEGIVNTIYPEIEEGPPRFAISRCNRWMIERSDYCICYVNHKWGGAYQFASLAKRKGLIVINLADVDVL